MNERSRRALITGISGQDGGYLVDLLLAKNYQVHGLIRRSSAAPSSRLELIRALPGVHLHDGDMTDAGSLHRLIEGIRPDEVYNLAAQSHVHVSFDAAEYTANVNALGSLRLLEAIRLAGLGGATRYYQAATSELFGQVRETPQSETTPFHPRSPYGVSKLYGYWITINYRESYGFHASNGILFNHESPHRGEQFATRKISRAAAAISLGLQARLELGNLDAERDWGHARDYVDGMWRMLQQDKPDDYVLATGRSLSVRDFARLAFAEVGIELDWEGSDRSEIGRDRATGAIRIAVNPALFRPAEVATLRGDAGKARAKLGWSATTPVEELVREMVAHDLAMLRQGPRGE